VAESRIREWDSLFVLERLGPELVSLAEKGELEFTYERTDLLSRLAVLMADRNVLLVGPEGVGKRSLMRALAYRIRGMLSDGGEKRKTAPDLFPYRKIYETTPFILDLDAHYAGELGQKLDRIASQAAEERAILFLLNAELAAGVGAAANAPASDIASVLSSCLERWPFRVVAETTPRGREILVRQAPSFVRRFAALEVPPLPEFELRPWFQRYEDHLSRRFSVGFGGGFTDEIVNACRRFFPTLAYPGKAIDLIREILSEKLATRREALDEPAGARAAPFKLGPSDVHAHIANLSGLSLEMIDSHPVPGGVLDEGLRSFFGSRVIGQPHAVATATAIVARYRARLNDPGKPIAVVWLSGPTGVGKTEFAKAVAEFFFGTAKHLLRYDMSEFKTRECVGRLLGYVEPRGVPREPSLVERVRARPFSVLLFDEVEKAHPEVMDLFLQLFDEATLTGADGTVAHFTNTIVLLTSNIGIELYGPPLGFAAGPPAVPDPNGIRDQLEEVFRPEFVNRIEHIVPFRRLDRSDVSKIMDREIRALSRLPGLAGRVAAVYLHPAVQERILNEGHVPKYGARPLQRAIARHVIEPLSFLLSTQAAGPESCVSIVPGDGARLIEGRPDPTWICHPLAPVRSPFRERRMR
jgi:ATP-dependent Clp protease ATP-binding subunit ClpC